MNDRSRPKAAPETSAKVLPETVQEATDDAARLVHGRSLRSAEVTGPRTDERAIEVGARGVLVEIRGGEREVDDVLATLGVNHRRAPHGRGVLIPRAAAEHVLALLEARGHKVGAR